MTHNDLTQQTKKHLVLLARQAGITGANRLRKTELIVRLRQILPTPSSAPVAITTPDDLSTQTHQSLLEFAKQSGLTGLGRLRKIDLLARLAAATSVQPSASASVAPDKVVEPEPNALVTAQPEEVPLDSTGNAFFPEPVSIPPPSAAALLSGYNDNRLVLLARDPHWLYAYWDFSTEEISAALTQLGVQEVRPILRIFDVTYIDFNGTNAWNHVDIELTPFATNWYIPVPHPDATYCAEVGYQSPDGRFATLGRSNVATTPRDGISPDSTLRWATPPEQQPSFLPAPQSQPVPLMTTQGSSPDGQELHSLFSAPSSAQHPSSWSFARGASPAQVRSGTIGA